VTWPTTSFQLTCDLSGIEHDITVSLPVRYDKLESAPVVVCLDGAWIFGTAMDATRVMSMGGEAPEAIVVGVSFAEQNMGEYLRQRARWYTPTAWVPPAETGVKGLEADQCGKADLLIAFITDQLLPRLEADYRIGERWFVGHSFSALFGMRALLAKPELFDKWLLASPSVWWHDRVILGFEETYATENDDMHAQVFLSTGELEDGDSENDYFRMRSNVEVLGASLASRGYPSLVLHRVVLADENHNSAIGAAISRGLRTLVLS
jgi:predicted alpha/beta superfamily hydrolase